MAPIKAATTPKKRKRGIAYASHGRLDSDYETITATRGKRQKTKRKSYVEDHVESEDFEEDFKENFEEDTADDKEYLANEILEERAGRYLIDWLEIDPHTGNPYEPTWVVKRDANSALVAAWEEKVAARKRKTNTTPKKASPKKGTSKATLKKPASRVRPVIESSAPSTPSGRPATVPDSPESIRAGASQQTAVSTPPRPGRPALHVQIEPPSNFEPTEYERFSQLPASSSTTEQDSQHQPIEESLGTSTAISAIGSVATGLVPDSQSSNGSGSYIPSITATSGSGSLQISATANEGHRAPTSTENRVVSPEPEAQSLSQEESLQILEIPESPVQEEPDSLDQDKILQTQASVGETVVQTSVPRFPRLSPVSRTVAKAIPGVSRHSEPPAPSTREDIRRVSDTQQSRSVPARANSPRRSVSPLFEPEFSPPNSPQSAQRSPEPLTGANEELEHQVQQHSQEQVPQEQALQEQASQEQASQEQVAQGESVSQQPSACPGKEGTTPHWEIRESAVPETVQADRVPQLSPEINQSVSCRDFATASQTTTTVAEKTTQHSLSHLEHSQTQEEQNAQIVPASRSQSPQSDSLGSIHPTVETQVRVCDNVGPPNSGQQRTSQQSPTPPISATSSVASPGLSGSLPRPPAHSIGTPDSIAPPRPETPVNTSSLFAQMAEEEGPRPALGIDNDYDATRRANPYVPKKRTLASLTPSIARSPSTISDRAPQQTQEPISLRNAALVNSAATQIPQVPSLAPPSTVPGIPDSSKSPETPKAKPSHQIDDEVGEDGKVEDDVIHDADAADEVMAGPSDDEDSGSLLEDDIQLQSAEYIVPLPMDGRQKGWYVHEISRAKDLLRAFLHDYHDFDRVDDVNRVLQRLKAVEAHVDLVYAGTGSPEEIIGPQTQAKWDYENCVKFRFLGALLDALKEVEIHILVVVKEQEDDERLLDMLERFCEGRRISYIYPAKARRADPSDKEGRVTVTVLSAQSSFIIRPPDAIISLNGAETSDIRRKNWAVHPDRRSVPVIHPMVPRSASHIERHVPSTLSTKKRLHTIFAALGQIKEHIGHPLVHSPQAPEAAGLVAQYLLALDNVTDGEPPEWPLPSICSIKEVVEYVSEPSPEQASPVAVPEASSRAASKRALDIEGHLDPSKRVRLTPQPPSSSSANEAAEITHISDSMPGTAAEPTTLEAALVQIALLQKELAKMKTSDTVKDRLLGNAQALIKDYRSQQATWEKQQNEYENLTKQYRIALGAGNSLQAQIEQGATKLGNLQQRCNTQVAELEKLRAEIKEINNVHASSGDEKVKAIVELRLDLERAKESERRAIASKTTTDSSLEYVRGEYQNAQNRASELSSENAQLTTDNEKLQRQASVVTVDLKKLQLGKSFQLVKDQNDKYRMENEALHKMMDRKDEEIARLKQPTTRGYGTRGNSLPRSPNPRQAGSRAASPIGGRDRVNTLRNG